MPWIDLLFDYCARCPVIEEEMEFVIIDDEPFHLPPGSMPPKGCATYSTGTPKSGEKMLPRAPLRSRRGKTRPVAEAKHHHEQRDRGAAVRTITKFMVFPLSRPGGSSFGSRPR